MNDQPCFADRLAAVEERIAAACAASGRRREEIALVAVSKFHPREAVEEAMAAGIADFGENYVQEALAKFPLPGARLHFIGALQRNKIRRILPLCHLVHGVASLSTLEAIDRIAGEDGLSPSILLQLHLTDEETKSGFSRDEIPAAMDAVTRLRHARVRGFMAMGPLEAGPGENRCLFEEARFLLARWREQGFPDLVELSMGMTADLEDAVAAGSTMLRVGTALFGSRPPRSAVEPAAGTP